MTTKPKAETPRPLDGNQEATEASTPTRVVVVVEGKGKQPDAATATHLPGNPAEGRDVASRSS